MAKQPLQDLFAAIDFNQIVIAAIHSFLAGEDNASSNEVVSLTVDEEILSP